MTSGAVAQFCASPTDLVKVRMQMEGQKILKGGGSGRPKTMIQTFGEVLAVGGFLGLWKGCVPNVQRAALVNLGDLTGKRGAALNDAIETAERLDNMWLEYAKKASPFRYLTL